MLRFVVLSRAVPERLRRSVGRHVRSVRRWKLLHRLRQAWQSLMQIRFE